MSRFEVKEELRFMGERLRKIRLKLKLTQEQTAHWFAPDRTSVSRYEQGRTKPPKSYVVVMLLLDRNPALLPSLCTLKVRE